MPVFQVSSKIAQQGNPPRRRSRRLSSLWSTIGRGVVASLIGGFFITLLINIFHTAAFVFLPVLVSLSWAQAQHYNITKLLTSTRSYLVLTVCLTIVYYSTITLAVAFIQQSSGTQIIIPIATALAWTIIFEPVRLYVQALIERRFNVRNPEAMKALENFTVTLREEIDLAQLRERFLVVMEQVMQPYFVSLWIRISKGQRERLGSSETMSVADDDPLIALLLQHPGTLLVEQARIDSPVLQDLKLLQAEILLPLASRGELIGLLVLGPHIKGEDYTREERTMLNGLAPQIAPALRVAQLVQEQQVEALERDRIEQELRTAQAIQHTFLPKEVPTFAGWQLAPYYRPAREVGGDFYDFLLREDGRLGIVIGDVTGKGVPAALVMATTLTMLRSAAQASDAPGEILAQVNELLASNLPESMFVTCFFALLDPSSGRLRYANAGHDLPLRRHNQGVAALWATGLPLGLMAERCYEEDEVMIEPGESLLFYSDGLTEAHNGQREMFDTSRLKAILQTHGNGTSLIEDVLDALKRFTGEAWEQEDDVTLVTLQRVPFL